MSYYAVIATDLKDFWRHMHDAVPSPLRRSSSRDRVVTMTGKHYAFVKSLEHLQGMRLDGYFITEAAQNDKYSHIMAEAAKLRMVLSD